MMYSVKGETALSVIDFGEERCVPVHTYGPATRTYYLIHYVASGCGVLSAEGKQWPVAAGQGFIIYPGEVTTYRADFETPWHYAWVGYAGNMAEECTCLLGLSRNQRVFHAPQPNAVWEVLQKLRQDAANLRLGTVAALGGFYRFLALAAPEKDAGIVPDHTQHYEKALWYMQGAYTRQVTVQEIADFVGLSRSQLFRVFEKTCGQSPKQALRGMQLQQAKLLLRNSRLPLEHIALSIGMTSAAQLSAAFKDYYGVSPRAYLQEWRKQKTQNQNHNQEEI